MKIKNAILASVLLAAVPVAVQAQEVENYDEYRVGCESSVDCNDFDVNYDRQSETNDRLSQRRTRTRRTRSSSSDKKIYAGGTLGIFFPSEIDDFDVGIQSGNITDVQTVDPGTGFGGSLYGGYKFSEIIGVDVEGFVFGGDADPLDSSYTSYGFFVNPRFTYSFNPDNFESFYVFASPGIGIAGVSFGDDLGDRLGDDSDSGTGFALQAKAGVGYPVSDAIDIIGQVRYFNAFNAIETTQTGIDQQITDTEDKNFNAFSVEAGVNFKF